MQTDSQAEREVLKALDGLDRAVRNRDLQLTMELFEKSDDTILVGSELGETAMGARELREFFERMFSGPLTYGYRWDKTYVRILGDLAWVFANGFIETSSVAGQHSHPYRVTAILRREGSQWCWVHYHGSEPAG